MTSGLVLFNLLVNANLALLGSLLLVALGLRLLSARADRLRGLLLLVPLCKAAYEVVRGIPEGAFFWLKLAGAAQEHGTFRIGFGVAPWVVPVVDASLGASFHGHDYPQSLADLLQTLLTRRGGLYVPALLGLALACFGLARFSHWLFVTIRAASRHQALLARAELLELRRLGRRSVRILISDHVTGVPFAGGVMRPWVCFPRQTFERLPLAEREAVLAHELAHIAHHDLLIVWLIQGLGSALAFLPGLGFLLGKVRAQMELAADAAAARTSAPESLASALVSVAELVRNHAQQAPELGLLRPDKLIARRVTRLLSEPHESTTVRARLLGLGLFALVAAAIFRATFLGNP
jgi:Zn-dependent protease with chaperone function